MGTTQQAQVSTRGQQATAGRRLALGHRLSGGGHWSLASRGSTPAPIRLFQIFLILKKKEFLEV
jgi:hypothetical protein